MKWKLTKIFSVLLAVTLLIGAVTIVPATAERLNQFPYPTVLQRSRLRRLKAVQR